MACCLAYAFVKDVPFQCLGGDEKFRIATSTRLRPTPLPSDAVPEIVLADAKARFEVGLTLSTNIVLDLLKALPVARIALTFAKYVPGGRLGEIA